MQRPYAFLRRILPLLMLIVVCLSSYQQTQSDAFKANHQVLRMKRKVGDNVMTSVRSLQHRSRSAASLPNSPSVSLVSLFSKASSKGIDEASSTNSSTSVTKPSPSSESPSSLFSINVLMFLFYGVLGTVLPYLPVFYSNLGVSANLIGVLGAITPAVTFLVSPLWGALADTTGWHKEIMLLTFIGSILARTALIWCNGNVVWLSLVVALSALLNAPVKPLLDSAIMSMLTDKSTYGKSRLFGQVGIGMGSFLVGPLLSTNYKLMFLAQLLLAAPTAFLMTRFQPKQQPPPSTASPTPSKTGTAHTSTEMTKKPRGMDVWQALKHTLEEPKVLVFFLLVFIVGVSSGIIENFAYVRLNQLPGAKGRTLGVMRLCSSLAGGPMFWISGEIIKLIGVNGVMNMSLLSYILRFAIYASVQNAWFALPAEVLRGFSFAMFWSGATYYVYGISPKGLTATMLGFLNGMYGGLGQSLGSLIGGYLSKRYGISTTFQRCAMVDLVILGIFLVYQRVEDFNALHPTAATATATVSSSPVTTATATATATATVTTTPPAPVRAPLFPPVRLSLWDSLVGRRNVSSVTSTAPVTTDPSSGHVPSGRSSPR